VGSVRREGVRSSVSDVPRGRVCGRIDEQGSIAAAVRARRAIHENTAQLDLGEGILWRAKFEPTGFAIHVVSPVAEQVALQAVFKVEGRPAIAAIRSKIDRGQILEIEQLG
jgi:hypothetical protein